MSTNLPQSWLSILLNDVGEIVTGKTPSTKNPNNFGGGIPFIKPADLDNGGYITRTADTLTDLGTTSAPTVPANSIPVTCIGNLGRVGITSQTSATNQQINTVVPSSLVEHRFFYHQLKTLKPWMQENASATTVTIINKGKFSKAPVTLLPLAEQKVIADKLDTLLAQVENTKARLEPIPQILKRFRQSVLAAAVSGRLTEEWRSSIESQKFESFEIPGSWTAVEIGDIADVKGGKRLPKGEELVSENTGYPYIRAGQLKNGTVISGLDNRNAQLFITESVQKVIGRYTINAGDAYMTIVGASIGDAGIVPESHHGANLTENAAKITDFKVDLKPRYLSAWLRSEYLQDLIRLETKSAAQGKLALSRIKTLPFPLPPVEEQTEIVRQVDQLFAHADRIEQQVNNALARVNNLTQSILTKAFRGELTEQWRKDNPELISGENSAEALLERIKVERVVTAKPKRRKSRA